MQVSANPLMPVSPEGSHTVLGRLRRAILTGYYGPGTQLRQDHVAAELGTSHIPVREAFRALAAEGLVRVEPRRGAFVTELSVDDLLDVTEVSIALESLAIRLAIARGEPRDWDAAEAALAAMPGLEDILGVAEQNWRFHRALYAPCGRPLLMRSIEQAFRHKDRYQRVLNVHAGYDRAIASQHDGLLAACRAGDAELAAERLTAHVRWACATLEQALGPAIAAGAA